MTPLRHPHAVRGPAPPAETGTAAPTASVPLDGSAGAAAPHATPYCLRCQSAARTVVWSQRHQTYIHAAIVGTDVPSKAPAICGGEVVRPGHDAYDLVLPGQVVLAQSVAATFTRHLVRLGSRASARNNSWRGTALCGATPGGSNHWLPVRDDPDKVNDLCDACAMARGAGHAA